MHGTYLLTPRCRVLLEKLTDLQLVKKFPAFYGTRRFITAFTSARHLSLSWTSSIQSIPPHPTSWRCILILSSHLRMGLPSGLFPWGFTTKTLYTPLPFHIRSTYPAHLINTKFNIQNFYTVITLHLHISCGTKKKQTILPYTSLRDWFYNRMGVFTARYGLISYIKQITFGL